METFLEERTLEQVLYDWMGVYRSHSDCSHWWGGREHGLPLTAVLQRGLDMCPLTRVGFLGGDFVRQLLELGLGC